MGVLSSITGGLQDITDDLQNYIVAPLAAFGLGGFVFNAEGESNAHLSADITDHYIEDNSAVQDHIAVLPKKITLKGYVGELVYNTNGGTNSPLNQLAQKLTQITAFLPTLSSAAQQLVAAGTPPLTFNGILGASANIYGLVQNVLGAFGEMKNQQNAYSYFQALMNSKTLMAVQTPWEFLTNMAIESITAIQDKKTKFVTDFAVTYKQIRLVQTTTAKLPNANSGSNITMTDLPPLSQSSIASAQQAPAVNNGNVPGAVTPETIAELGN